MWASPSPCGPWRPASTWSGSTPTPNGSSALRADDSYVEDVRLRRRRRANAPAATSRPRNRSAAPASTSPSSTSRPLSTTACPISPTSRSAAEMLSRYLRPGATVIVESTTYPGTTEELVGPILENGSGLTAGATSTSATAPNASTPATAAGGSRTSRRSSPGVDAASLDAVKGFFDRLVETTVAVSGTREAELTKLLENTFRHVNIALVNELAMFAGELGIDVWEAIGAASSKPFGYMPFTPGPGVGGHCLPIDPSYLSWKVRRTLGRSFRFVELANDVNEHMPDYVVQRLVLALNRMGRP